MAGRLLADLATAGELASFLAGELAAAMWRTGRAAVSSTRPSPAPCLTPTS